MVRENITYQTYIAYRLRHIRQRGRTSRSCTGIHWELCLKPVIELLTRPGCHLCEDARLTVSEICAEYGLDYTELDITDNPDLLKRHETEIPVLRIDGEAKDFWRINPKRMRKILDKKLAR